MLFRLSVRVWAGFVNVATICWDCRCGAWTTWCNSVVNRSSVSGDWTGCSISKWCGVACLVSVVVDCWLSDTLDGSVVCEYTGTFGSISLDRLSNGCFDCLRHWSGLSGDWSNWSGDWSGWSNDYWMCWLLYNWVGDMSWGRLSLMSFSSGMVSRVGSLSLMGYSSGMISRVGVCGVVLTFTWRSLGLSGEHI